jgi:ATP synthase F1 delta subunit
VEEIATVYARAMFEAADDADRLDLIRDQLGQFTDALDKDRELQVFFFSPYFSSEEKKDGLHRAVDEADPLLINFLELLIDNHRMPVVFRTRRAYDDLWQERNRLLPVSVTSAVVLPEDTVRAIGDRIAEQTGRRVDLSSHVDADILGGIVVRVGNQILDASIRNRLDQLRKQVARA